MWTSDLQAPVKCIRVAPSVSHHLSIEWFEAVPVPAPSSCLNYVANRGFHGGRVSPICADEDASCPADHIHHIGQEPEAPVQGAVQVVDEYGALDLPSLSKHPCVLKFLLEGLVSGEMLAWMCLSGIQKDGGDALCLVLLRNPIERWRRQRAIWSGEGAKFDYKVLATPELAEA